MHRKKVVILILLILGAALAAGEFAFAVGPMPIPPIPRGSSAPAGGLPVQRTNFGTGQLVATLDLWGTALFILLMVVSTIMFLVGGFHYLTSQGDSEKVKTATKTIVFGLLALAVGIVAKGLPILVDQLIAR